MHIIGGERKNHPIVAPKSRNTRPTSSRLRETLFNICQGYIEGARFLDLFAGSGAMGLEALSRGAIQCSFVDSDLQCVRCIKANIERMGWQSKCTVFHENVFSWLERWKISSDGYTIIFADPPYDASFKQKNGRVSFSQAVITFIDQYDLLVEGGVLFIEDSTDFQPDKAGLAHLKLVNERKTGRSSLLQFQKISS